MNDYIILFAFPVFAVTLFADWLVMWLKGNKKYYQFADTITNIHLGIGSQVISLVIGIIFFLMYDYLHSRFSFFTLSNTWYVWLLCVVMYDFVYYWAHRWSHELNFLWGAHVVHHQSEYYNLSVALRQPSFHNLIAFPIFSLFPFLGFETKLFFAAGIFVTLYQYWIHTQAIGKLPGLIEYVFNTPSHHRVHHAVNAKYIDRNYGAVFIIWDRIFGTFVPETEKPVYGITTRFKSFNPIWANFYYYIEMWQLAKNMKSFKNKIKMIWSPPGVLPEPVNRDIEKPMASPETQERALSVSQKIYVFIQFIIIVVGVALLMNSYSDLKWHSRIFFVGLTIFSLLNIGAILENRNHIKYAEFLRISVGLVSISLVYYQQFYAWFWYMLPTLSILAALLFILLILENYIDDFLANKLQIKS